MFFIPLSQIESVELVIHSLKAAGGEADCQSCPASKVCMKQCLTIAKAIEQMFGEGGLPDMEEAKALLEEELTGETPFPDDEPLTGNDPGGKPLLKLIKS